MSYKNSPFFISLIVCLSIYLNASSQVITKEDSLNAGLIAKNVSTLIGGYGEAMYRNNLKEKTASANLARNVIFLGHKFNNQITFFSEIEFEDARVEGGEVSGEISIEQAFLKFNINRNNYISAGLFIPRIGIINENHLPTTFFTVARPRLEKKIIPATWRELGVCVYGVIPSARGLNYSFGILNGLNSANFDAATGIRDGRYKGRYASASSLALTGSLLYYVGNFRIQASGYFGGSAGMSPKLGDSLGLKTGAFGTPVSLEELNVQYRKNGIYGTLLMSALQIPDAGAINNVYKKNVASSSLGYYAELGYNILEKTKFKNKKLLVFSRYESIDMNAELPANATEEKSLKQSYLFTGLAFLPIPGIIIKADFEQQKLGMTGNFPFTKRNANTSKSNFINLGIGFSF